MFLSAILLIVSASHAQDTANDSALSHARTVAQICPGQWENQDCMKAVSKSNLVLAANYMEKLDTQNRPNEMEQIKQHCAASTAATEGDFPAYAIKSAFIECANKITDITGTTGIEPNLSHYQILVGSVLCMNNDARCAGIEQGLRDLK